MTLFISGAGSGIGLQLAKLGLQRGRRVALFDLTFDDSVRGELASMSSQEDRMSIHSNVDVRDPAALHAAFLRAVRDIGRPSLAINSAGISRNELFAESHLDLFEETVAINLVGSRNFAAAALPHLMPGSRLALIASLAGITGGYTYAAYASSKAGVIGLARVLRVEWAQDGIGVSVICPPEIMTPMVQRYDGTMHPATRALKDVAGTLPLEEACLEMLDQLDRGRFMVIPGRRARRTVWMTRLLPESVTIRMTDRIVRRAIAASSDSDRRLHPEPSPEVTTDASTKSVDDPRA